jgi:hypothetical protein
LVNRRWSGTTRLGDPSEEPEFEPVEVEVVTLDGDLTGTSARTACVKIDVEGGEVDVVNGGMEFLRGLEDFACLVEILHLPSDALAELSRRFDFYLWDLRLERFSRVAPCDPASFEARLASGAYYRQDAVLRPRDDPSMKARAQASAQDIGDLMASLTRREAELLRTDQVRVSKAELERLRRDRAQLGEVLSSRSFRWMAGPRRGASAVRSLTRRFR